MREHMECGTDRYWPCTLYQSGSVLDCQPEEIDVGGSDKSAFVAAIATIRRIDGRLSWWPTAWVDMRRVERASTLAIDYLVERLLRASLVLQLRLRFRGRLY